MLTLTFLGVGSAFAKRNYQSNALIEAWSADPSKQNAPVDTLLVDFGTTGPLALHALKSEPGFAYLDRDGIINYPAIGSIFVTHVHSDHVGGLEELAGMNVHHFGGVRNRPQYKPRIISARSVLDNLWEHSLSGGLGAAASGLARLEDYFDVLGLGFPGRGGPDRFTMLGRYDFTIIATDHIRVQHKYDWPSCGLIITDRKNGETVFYSGDTRFDPENVGEILTAAKLIFHEVQIEEQPDAVHAQLSDLRTLTEDVRKKMVLYHVGDEWDDPAYDFVADEFTGFAKPRHRYTLFG